MIFVAEAMIDGKIDLLEGSRSISSLRLFAGFDADAPVFNVFRATASDLDHIALSSSEENLYAPSLLKQWDLEKQDYLTAAQPDIIKGAHELVEYLKLQK